MKRLGLMILVFWVGCMDSDIVYSKIMALNQNWSKDKRVVFRIPVVKSKAYDIKFQIRNTGDYPYRNIYLFTHLTHKNQTKVDTLEYQLADLKGRWLGDGSGGVKTNWLWYAKGLNFKTNDTIILEVKQAMRNDNLPGITDLGIQVKAQAYDNTNR